MTNAKKTLTDQTTQDLVARLKQKITSGEYRPGEWLKQIDIEQTFEVNRFTVRSAFSELQSSGFLHHEPYKGYRVIEHSLQERIELTEAREVIECAAAANVLANIDDAGLEQLESLAEAFLQAVEEDMSEEMFRLNAEFHRCFNAYYRNLHLSQMIDDLRERGVGSANRGWSKKAIQRDSALDHINMVQALKEKNLVRLQAVIHAHLNRWRQAYPELSRR
ncbi:GntR family transcriptional regulator [Marinobacterium mangrovicola]|uniref:DNA-binding GntR family transcriptional regulator n=1 Tax=Marinobacterium mangrovicola TaxID=1476959 RepID=A0A4R1GLN6_9GAMM|nr:GntR family transcriptional regulator [Marinobacterium mangrovicola]TCK09178.1 DNA-binding GntR family transcriptional regulator [Marinobacterium mangrovicola]